MRFAPTRIYPRNPCGNDGTKRNERGNRRGIDEGGKGEGDEKGSGEKSPLQLARERALVLG